jgi:5'-methylthioadenosine phosphorylase
VTTIGVIGGSGLYEMPGLEHIERRHVDTPFGDPSDDYVCGRLGDTRLVFLPRHGRGHHLLPTEINFRANIHGMKQLGVEYLIGVGAVGSLTDGIAPGHLVVPDQLIDRTFRRPSTFFGDGLVAHVAFADPFCSLLATALHDAGAASGGTVHRGGVYVCMEGPQFSTRAESHLYRSWGGTVIGMTNLQEAKLAREAELCFATLALVSDYDCWNEEAGDVEIEEVLRILRENVSLAQRIIGLLAQRLPKQRSCPCARALETAIVTDRAAIPEATRRKLELLVGKYLGQGGA